MSTFSFDCETNIINNKIPAAKAINADFCGEETGGLWIADENLCRINWKKNCTETCEESCTNHFVGTKFHSVKTSSRDSNGKKISISGRGIINPRIIVVRRSKMLKFNNKNQYAGLWVKGDGLIREDNQKKYSCQMKYVLIFVDENNYPLHSDFVQLSTKGTFMVDFDNKYMEFRRYFLSAYTKDTKRQMGKAIEQWYSMCVFVPTFGSKVVKSTTKSTNGEFLESDACFVESYIQPTENNWKTLCIGRDVEINEIVTYVYNQTEDWYKRYTTNPVQETSNNNNKIKKLFNLDSSQEEEDEEDKNSPVKKPSYRVKQPQKN